MKGRDKLKAWLEIEQERDNLGICRTCFIKSLKVILNDKYWDEIKKFA